MRTFSYKKNDFNNASDTVTTLLQDISKYQYKLEHIIKTNSNYFKKLETNTVIDESYNSFKLEGINLNYNRLKEITKRPSDFCLSNKFEKEALGYAMFIKALNAKLDSFEVNTTSLLAMYRIIFGDNNLSKKGLYRKNNTQKMLIDNKVVEIDISPVEAFETPLYTGSAIQNLNSSIDNTNLLNPLNIAKFNVDFMCIRPFDIGSGRLCRLFSLLCLYKSNITIAKYISISKIFNHDIKNYYNQLNLSSENWAANKNSYEYFVVYFLEGIKRSYNILFENFTDSCTLRQNHSRKTNKQDLIKKYISKCTEDFRKSDILYNFPNISESTVEATLKKLLDSGYIKKIGNNKGAKYIHIKPDSPI